MTTRYRTRDEEYEYTLALDRHTTLAREEGALTRDERAEKAAAYRTIQRLGGLLPYWRRGK